MRIVTGMELVMTVFRAKRLQINDRTDNCPQWKGATADYLCKPWYLGNLLSNDNFYNEVFFWMNIKANQTPWRLHSRVLSHRNIHL